MKGGEFDLIKSYRFRIYPNKKQEELIQKTFGCVRFVYNYFLDRRISKYKESREKFGVTLCSKELTQLKKEKEWLKEPDKWALQNALWDLDEAYQMFFKGVNRFPKFKWELASFIGINSVILGGLIALLIVLL